MDWYYTTYECKAENQYGTVVHVVKLAAAHNPGKIQQVILENITPTSLRFQLVPPEDNGGLPVDFYVAEYKHSRQPWKDSRRRYWFKCCITIHMKIYVY